MLESSQKVVPLTSPPDVLGTGARAGGGVPCPPDAGGGVPCPPDKTKKKCFLKSVCDNRLIGAIDNRQGNQ